MGPFLLLQARGADHEMAAHERACFAAAMGVPADELHTHDLVTDSPLPMPMASYAAALIGGSGDYNGRDQAPWLLRAIAFAQQELIAPGVPTFGCCFGLHLLGRALGVEVINEPPHREVGTFAIETATAAADCPIFGALPAVFLAQQGHNDRLASLPTAATLLCRNAQIPVQAFRLSGRPIWATQFHPELDMASNKTRYMRYIVNYSGPEGPPADDPVLASLRPTPLATDLLRRFAALVSSGRIARP